VSRLAYSSFLLWRVAAAPPGPTTLFFVEPARLALKADLSAWRMTSLRVPTSQMWKKLLYDAVSTWLAVKSRDIPSVSAKRALKLVKDTIILVQIAQLCPQVLVDRDGLDRLALHGKVPDLEGEVVAREHVFAVPTEFQVRDRADDLGKERLV
jgi:hypothetical protein